MSLLACAWEDGGGPAAKVGRRERAFFCSFGDDGETTHLFNGTFAITATYIGDLYTVKAC